MGEAAPRLTLSPPFKQGSKKQAVAANPVGVRIERENGPRNIGV